MHVPYAQLYVAMSRPPADPPAQGRRRAPGETAVSDTDGSGDAAARRAVGLWSRLRHRTSPTAAPAPARGAGHGVPANSRAVGGRPSLSTPPATAVVPPPRDRADEPVRH